MQFDKNHKVKHWLLEDKEEARAFIDFLKEERVRHEAECENAEHSIEGCCGYYNEERLPYFKALVELWQSQVIRHNEDIEAIDKSIAEVKDRLKL